MVRDDEQWETKAKVQIPAWPILVMSSWANDLPVELWGPLPEKGGSRYLLGRVVGKDAYDNEC